LLTNCLLDNPNETSFFLQNTLYKPYAAQKNRNIAVFRVHNNSMYFRGLFYGCLVFEMSKRLKLLLAVRKKYRKFKIPLFVFFVFLTIWAMLISMEKIFR